MRFIVPLRDWALVSAGVAEVKTNASCAAVQRNPNWMAKTGIIREAVPVLDFVI